MFSTASILPLAPALPLAAIAFHVPTTSILLLLAAAGLAQLAMHRRRAHQPARVALRLVPTANAWGYSERAQLDESAVGL